MSLLKSVQLLIQLDELKGSVNSMMIPARGRKGFIYSGNYRSAKKKVEEYLVLNYLHLKNYLADCPTYYYTTVHYRVYDAWFTKSSKYMQLRKKDVSNYTKNAEDVIFSFLGIDDSSIIRSTVEKRIIERNKCCALQCNIALYAMEKDTALRINDDVFWNNL